jgi:hypothetical protein
MARSQTRLGGTSLPDMFKSQLLVSKIYNQKLGYTIAQKSAFSGCDKVMTLERSFRSPVTAVGDADCYVHERVFDTCHKVSRRAMLLAPAILAGVFSMDFSAQQALAFTPPPPGYSVHVDKLDGYSFLFPEDWIPVTTSGNDVFYRNPFNAEENLFVDISSPSSSKYASVEDFGSPDEAAKKTLEQYLEEFMSTRLGVKRTAEIEKATSRTGPDGKIYYDIETRVTSYASRNQLAVTQGEIDEAIVLEFDRKYLTVLGAANNRLYALRLQTGTATFDKDPERLYKVAQSFTCKSVDI